MKSLGITDNPIASVAASLFFYLVAFGFVGGFLSHYLFVWGDYAAAAAFSKTLLCDIYIAVAIPMILGIFFQHANIVEAICVGALLGAGAGGIYCCGYVTLLIPVLVAVIVFVVLMLFKLGPIRAVYFGLGVGTAVSLVLFLPSAITAAPLKALSGVSSSSITSVTNIEWGAMSASQREEFLSYVAAKEASNLGVDNVAMAECVLPEDVVATVDENGRILINYAAIRVACPTAQQIQNYIEKNRNKEQAADSDYNKSITWTYEALTSARYFIVPLCHAVGHVYQELRVDGSLSESPNWPYEDADEQDGSNPTLDEWREQLPVNPLEDVESSSSSLENQAWNFGYACVSTYVRSE